MAYNSQQRAEALTALELNQGNLTQTAEQLGIGVATLSRWVDEDSEIGSDKSPIAQEASEKLPEVKQEFLDRLIVARDKTLEHLDNNVQNLKPREAAVALGILIDKVELLKGNATQRVESVGNGETVNEAIERIRQEFESRISRAQILEVASTRSGDGEEEPITTAEQLD